MAKIPTVDTKTGKLGKTLEADDLVFKAALRKDLLNDYIVLQRRAKRQGTHSTLTRSEVAGTGKKPFRQKGTGNARQGSLKGPHQEGGGVVFGPKPRVYSAKMNKKAKKAALRSAISQRLFEGDLMVADKFEIASGKTKDAQKFVDALQVKGVLFVGNFSEATERSIRNLEKSKALPAHSLNVQDILWFKKVVLTTEAMEWIAESWKPAEKKEGEAA